MRARVCVVCRSSKADVVFVIDSSGSIGRNNFVKVQNFIKNIVDSFGISNNTVRVGLVQFSSSVVVEFNLLRYSNKNDITAAVQALQYHDGGKKHSTLPQLNSCMSNSKNQHTQLNTSHSALNLRHIRQLLAVMSLSCNFF